MMNFPGVLARDEAVLDKLVGFAGWHVDGHAPLVRGYDLNAYLALRSAPTTKVRVSKRGGEAQERHAGADARGAASPRTWPPSPALLTEAVAVRRPSAPMIAIRSRSSRRATSIMRSAKRSRGVSRRSPADTARPAAVRRGRSACPIAARSRPGGAPSIAMLDDPRGCANAVITGGAVVDAAAFAESPPSPRSAVARSSGSRSRPRCSPCAPPGLRDR